MPQTTHAAPQPGGPGHSMPSASEPRIPAPGRPVLLEPAPKGLWWVLLGGFVAALAPLFGFLVGVMVGPDFEAPLPPMYGGLLFGFIVSAGGLLATAYGARTLYIASKARHEA